MLSVTVVCPWSAWGDDVLADLPDPTRPHNPAPPRATGAETPASLILESTVVSPQRRLAVVNGKTVAVGERIAGARIVAISPYEVIAERNGQELRLRLLPGNVTSLKRLNQVHYERAAQ